MFLRDYRQCQGAFTTPLTVIAPTTTTSGGSTYTKWGSSTRTIIRGWTGSDGIKTTESTVSTDYYTTVVSSGTLWAEPVVVYWKSSDLSHFPSAYASILASAMGLTAEDETSATGSSSGIQTGVKAGITIGAIFAVAVFGGILVFLRLRMRKRMRRPDLPEMSGQSSGLKRLFHGKWRAEMETKSEPVEIDSRKVLVIPGPPVELDGSQIQRRRSEDTAAT